jgi:hypothetical protein
MGHEDGSVSLWRLHPRSPLPRLEELWRRQTHVGSVTDVRLSGMFVLSGGMDRTISLFTLGDNWSTSEPSRLHRTIECAGMKINGVKGSVERALLESLLHAEGGRSSQTPAPASRPIHTPADVFDNRPRRSSGGNSVAKGTAPSVPRPGE